MHYLTVKEAAEEWGVGTRIVTLYCVKSRIAGAVKRGNLWLIPADAPRPADKRRREKDFPQQSLSADLADVIAATTVPMPSGDPDSILHIVTDHRLRLQYGSELAYLRGDFQRALRCFSEAAGDDAARLRACPVAIAAAINLGDYLAYTEVEAFAKGFLKEGGLAAIIAEISLAVAAVSCVAPGMVPDRIKAGDFSALPSSAIPYAHYLRAMYFNCTGRPEAMLAVAETALSFCAPQAGILMHDIYLRLMCAVACRHLEREEEARRYLLDAMRIALPHGFITPFSEFAPALGGLMEQCLVRSFPNRYDAVINQWKRTWKNWIGFHNQFTKENITSILSLREHHIAVLAARRVPYAKIAEEYCISVGRLKNIMLEIYEKLFISGRDELIKYIM